MIKIRDNSGQVIAVPGLKGSNGKSAYDYAVAGGYKGTEQDFIDFLNNTTTIMNEHVVDPEAHADIRELITQLQNGLENAGTGHVSEHDVNPESHADIRGLITQLQNALDNVDVSEQISAHNTSAESHSDIRNEVSGLREDFDNLSLLKEEDITKQVSAHNTSAESHADIRGLITQLQNALDNVDVSEQISAHNTSAESHNDIRELINDVNTRLNALADSDDATLDQLSEIVEYIKSNKTLIEAITVLKLGIDDVVDNLNSTATDKPLSANQGRILSEKIDNIEITGSGSNVTVVDNLTTDDPEAALSAKQGKILNDKIDNLDFAEAFDIVDNLTTDDPEAALSANQGKVLNDKVEDIKSQTIVADYNESLAKLKLELKTPVQGTVVDTLESNSATDALSANQGRILNEKVLELEKDIEVIGTGGSDVEIIPALTSGTKIGSVIVDGTSTDLYAPEVITYSEATQTEDGLMSTEDKTKLDGINMDTKVDKTTTINGKTLSSDITLSAADVGADAAGSASSALSDAKEYTDGKIDAIVGEGASTTLDTIGEISKAIEDHKDVTDALNAAIGNKVDKVSGKGLSTNDYTTAEKNKLAGIADGANNTVVDSALSSTSTNPVQNKVVNTALAGKANSSHGNHVPATQTANNAVFLRNDNTWATVTPANIGLGNVPNVATNDQTPTYTAATTDTNLTSGEKLSTAFGKIAKAISSLISHLANKSNPHAVTKTQVGLGNCDNTSDANKPISTATQTALDNINSDLSYQNLLLSAGVYGIGTDYKTYDCNWQGYELLTIAVGHFSNIIDAVTVPATAYFSTTSTGKRIFLYVDSTKYCEIFQGGAGKVTLRVTEALSNSANYAVMMYGMIKRT